MADEIKTPAIVLELAKQAANDEVPNPNPIAWRQTADGWVIVFEDGRKLTFDSIPVTPHISKIVFSNVSLMPEDAPPIKKQKK